MNLYEFSFWWIMVYIACDLHYLFHYNNENDSILYAFDMLFLYILLVAVNLI